VVIDLHLITIYVEDELPGDLRGLLRRPSRASTKPRAVFPVFLTKHCDIRMYHAKNLQDNVYHTGVQQELYHGPICLSNWPRPMGEFGVDGYERITITATRQPPTPNSPPKLKCIPGLFYAERLMAQSESIPHTRSDAGGAIPRRWLQSLPDRACGATSPARAGSSRSWQ
jgi:hypothetical protein